MMQFARRGEGTGDGICSDAKRPYPGSFTHRALNHDTNRPNTPLTSGSGPGAPRSEGGAGKMPNGANIWLAGALVCAERFAAPRL